MSLLVLTTRIRGYTQAWCGKYEISHYIIVLQLLHFGIRLKSVTCTAERASILTSAGYSRLSTLSI
jgi:hypothetical protein